MTLPPDAWILAILMTFLHVLVLSVGALSAGLLLWRVGLIIVDWFITWHGRKASRSPW